MKKQITRTENRVALVPDRPLRDEERAVKFRRSVDKIHEKYAGLFQRLAN